MQQSLLLWLAPTPPAWVLRSPEGEFGRKVEKTRFRTR
ncbi:hypothetical protein PORUE0001_1624 [Porphyromonas uenonis 60-3]|uniref:Uncharacterized protein n=1 Tax=Porphyromonas uenonis 60-3 TaxID=596327 RepID=C2M9Z4_9PORP|nr:hypothetical protein PORUE0001_1624 [Porphyromonas uenonis 60-3]